MGKTIFKLIICRRVRTSWTSWRGVSRGGKKVRSWHANEIGVGSDGVWDVGLAIYSSEGQMHIYYYIFTSCCKSVDVALNYKHANRVSFYVLLELNSLTATLIVYHI